MATGWDSIVYVGIAFAGKKCAGKDFLTKWFVEKHASVASATQREIEIIRTKTPIVQAFEKITGREYRKGVDDFELVQMSRDVIRKDNDQICAEYLMNTLPEPILARKIVVIPDLRRIPEFVVLHRHLSIMCVKVEADEFIRRERMIRDYGSDDAYDPTDITETDVEVMPCPYIVDNNREDGGTWAITQLSNYLARHPGLNPTL